MRPSVAADRSTAAPVHGRTLLGAGASYAAAKDWITSHSADTGGYRVVGVETGPAMIVVQRCSRTPVSPWRTPPVRREDERIGAQGLCPGIRHARHRCAGVGAHRYSMARRTPPVGSTSTASRRVRRVRAVQCRSSRSAPLEGAPTQFRSKATSANRERRCGGLVGVRTAVVVRRRRSRSHARVLAIPTWIRSRLPSFPDQPLVQSVSAIEDAIAKLEITRSFAGHAIPFQRAGAQSYVLGGLLGCETVGRSAHFCRFAHCVLSHRYPKSRGIAAACRCESARIGSAESGEYLTGSRTLYGATALR